MLIMLMACNGTRQCLPDNLMVFRLIRPKNNPPHNRLIANPSYLQLNYFKQIWQTLKDLPIIRISLFAGHN